MIFLKLYASLYIFHIREMKFLFKKKKKRKNEEEEKHCSVFGLVVALFLLSPFVDDERNTAWRNL